MQSSDDCDDATAARIGIELEVALPAPAERPDGQDVEAAFRAAMRLFTGTVTIVTACAPDGTWRGIAATAVTSVAMDPPTLLVCVNRGSSLHPALVATRRFCVNGMHQDHHGLMPGFTKPEHREGRFRTGDWRHGPDGVPVLAGAQFSILCEVAECASVGTHDVVLGRVREVATRADWDPLLYGAGTYLRQAGR